MNPEGHYTKVHCYDIQKVGGEITDGTGTFTHSTQTFSCGPFAANDRPKVGSHYNLNGEHKKGEDKEERYEFPGWKCTHSGDTSSFKER
jgi:hypothetical protein